MQVDGSTQVALVTAKARMLQVKHTTILKVELLEALLVANNIHPWTDSVIVLHRPFAVGMATL